MQLKNLNTVSTQTPFVMSKVMSKVMPQVMGILNVTPDSFSDGGKFAHIDKALAQVETMIAHGASYIDIGGESTRPGAVAVSSHDELERVIPVLKAIKARFTIQVSIDTSKASVMAESIEHGADLINDVRALQNEGCLEVIAQSHLPVCIMHMQGTPTTMQTAPSYTSVVSDVYRFFEARIAQCEAVGIKQERIIIDPGFGFGKTLEQNYELLAKLPTFKTLGTPILVGTSRKSMIGNLLNKPVNERLAGSLATALIGAQKGANIIRVHDVAETMDVLKVLQASSGY